MNTDRTAQPYPQKRTNVPMLLLLIFLNMMFVLGPYIGIWASLVGVGFASFGVMLGGVVAIVAAYAPNYFAYFAVMPKPFLYEPMGVAAFGLGLCAMGVLLLIGSSALSEYLVKATSHYFKWMKSLI